MWNAQITQIDKQADGLRIKVLYVNGAEKIEDIYTANNTANDHAWLKRTVSSRIDQLTANDLLQSQLSLGPVDVTGATTPVDQEFSDFYTDYKKLQSMQKAVDVGLKKTTDQDFIDLTTKVKAAYLPEYNGKF